MAQVPRNEQYIAGKSIDELLAAMVGVAEVRSPVHEQIKTAVFARTGQELAAAMRDASASSDRLGRRVFWLNWILVALTGVGAIATALGVALSSQR